MNENRDCQVYPVEKSFDPHALENAMAAYLVVQGMGCPRCAIRVRNGLLSLDGVLLAEVQLEQGIAAAAFDPQRVTLDDLITAVASAGNDGRHHYQAELIREAPAMDVVS
jgi:copper chaperone CopZ